MVISHIFGGLGNQMFQYAAGKRISEKYSVPLLLDTSAFDTYKLRNLELGFFNTGIRIASLQEIDALKPSSNFRKLIQYTRPKVERTYHRERSFNYDTSFEAIGPEVYLKGYFQCEPYFHPIIDTIRSEFTIRSEYLTKVHQYSNRLTAPNAVGIHIRRGDYNNKDVMQLLAKTEATYYQKAILLVEQKVTNPVFFFFSDDIEWVKENLQVAEATYVSGNWTSNAIEDFYLLSQCANQIIPNSTFAWWAAFLNPNPSKVIVAPARWFNDLHSNRDRVPSDWYLV